MSSCFIEHIERPPFRRVTESVVVQRNPLPDPTKQKVFRTMQTLQSLAMIRTSIPFRLDRLPWSRFHLLVVIGLGITWILDGLEVTIVGSLGPALQSAETLHLSSNNLGAVASFYVVGAVVGALVFGWITDRFGRRLVFYITLIVYLSGVLLSAFAWDFWSFAIFRMITGLGIGGEYAAVNSAIDLSQSEISAGRYVLDRCSIR